jgi:3-hydroxyisobutyrate dehydrogenase
MQIGVAGLGRMGAAIATRLMEVGHTLTVWNRSPEKAQPLADKGARVVKTPAEVASASETIITILTDPAAIDAVYRGPHGLLAGDVKGKLFIEMSTVPPEAQQALAEKVRGKGGAFVECPVGGSTTPALQGKLLGLMGAEPADAARAKPILDQLCRKVLHGGPVGSGAVLKFTVNMPLMIYWQALGEALALSRSLNIDPAELLEFLSDTSGAANVLKIRVAPIAAALKGGDGGPITFDLDSGIKDIRFMLAEAKRRGVELPVLQQTLACYEEARRNGSGAAGLEASVTGYWPKRGAK